MLGRTSLADERRKSARYAKLMAKFAQETVEPREPPADDALTNALDAALMQLAPSDRELVGLKYEQCLSVCEIAERLGTSESAVESRLVRARQKVRDAISGRPHDE